MTNTTHEHVSREPKKAGCCGGEHGKHKVVPLTEKGQPAASTDDKHGPVQHAHSGSCGCGSGKAKK